MTFGYVSFGELLLSLMSFGVLSFGLLSVYRWDVIWGVWSPPPPLPLSKKGYIFSKLTYVLGNYKFSNSPKCLKKFLKKLKEEDTEAAISKRQKKFCDKRYAWYGISVWILGCMYSGRRKSISFSRVELKDWQNTVSKPVEIGLFSLLSFTNHTNS